MGRVLINGNGWTLSCSAEIRALSIVGGVTLILLSYVERYYDTKRYYTNSYNIFDLKSLHLKLKSMLLNFVFVFE